MNKYIILFITGIILFTSITCVYFDPYAAAGLPSLFWLEDSKRVYRMPPDNPDERRDFNLDPFPSNFLYVSAMAMDPVAGKMYIGIMGDLDGGICRANYDGTGAEMIVTSSMEINGIAIDYYTREMYWSEATIIRKISLDEPEKVIEVFDTQVYISDLEVDMAFHQLFFVDGSDSFYYMPSFGDFSLQINLTPAGALASKIELSLFDNKIYWFNDYDQTIYHSNIYDGSDTVQISPINLPGFIDFSLDLETGNLFWADMDGIYRIRTDGSMSEEQVLSWGGMISFAADCMNAHQY
jgi:hypothetical protein